jgi:hypothetical protein
MKKTYIISYDLHQPGQNYEELLKRIKSYSGWARLGGSAYVILTDKGHAEIRDYLKAVLDKNDKIFVGKVSAPAAWFGLGTDVSNWLIDKLKE